MRSRSLRPFRDLDGQISPLTVPDAPTPEWLTPRQAADVLGSSIDEIRAAASTGLVQVRAERGYPRYLAQDVRSMASKRGVVNPRRASTTLFAPRLAAPQQKPTPKSYGHGQTASSSAPARLDPTQWLVPMQAADMLDCSVDEVRRLSSGGVIEMRKERGYPRYSRTDLAKIAADRSRWIGRALAQPTPTKKFTSYYSDPLRMPRPTSKPKQPAKPPRPKSEPDMLTPMEAASYLGINHRQLQALSLQGKIDYETTRHGTWRYRKGKLKLPLGMHIDLEVRRQAPAITLERSTARPVHRWHRYETVSEGDVYDAGSRELVHVAHKACTCGAAREVVRRYTPLLGTRVVEIRRIA